MRTPSLSVKEELHESGEEDEDLNSGDPDDIVPNPLERHKFHIFGVEPVTHD